MRVVSIEVAETSPVTDPRHAVIGRRLEGVGRLLAFCSAKGGVGKSFTTAAAGLALAREGRRVGILDVDFSGASIHLFLGVRPRLPQEAKGILPLVAAPNLWLMTAAAFTGERALPLRGPAVSDAILELLAVTQWGELDALLLDMPPGIADSVLDIARFVPRLRAMVLSTPETVSVAVAERLLALLVELNVGVAGVMATMVRGEAEPVIRMASRQSVTFAGSVRFDPAVETAVGHPEALADCEATRSVRESLRAAGLA